MSLIYNFIYFLTHIYSSLNSSTQGKIPSLAINSPLWTICFTPKGIIQCVQNKYPIDCL